MKVSKLGSFVMLGPGSTEVKFDCGCKFVNEVNAVFGLCPMHEAAPDLLAALESFELYPCVGESCRTEYPAGRCPGCQARAVITKVEEKE